MNKLSYKCVPDTVGFSEQEEGGQTHELESRLRLALTNLRSQILSANRNEKTFIRDNNNSGDMTEPDPSYNRTRELHKLLIQSRTREANLQDGIDKMKSELCVYRNRIEELESAAETWRLKFEHVSQILNSEREENTHRLQVLKQSIFVSREHDLKVLREKEELISELRERIVDSRKGKTPRDIFVADVVVLDPQTVDHRGDHARCLGRPFSAMSSPTTKSNSCKLFRSSRNLSSSVIPDVSRVFSTARNPPLFKFN
jgi:hypothetical protein